VYLQDANRLATVANRIRAAGRFDVFDSGEKAGVAVNSASTEREEGTRN
jgi:hypothetical protein